MKHRNKTIAAALSGLALVAACGGRSTFLAAVQNAARGTWACSLNEMSFTVGVKGDGQALFQADGSDVYAFAWSIDGGQLTLGGPQGSQQSATVDLSKVEQGTISHTDTSQLDAGQLIGGAPGAISNVEWDFAEHTVSFQHQDEDGNLGGRATCRRIEDDVTMTATPTQAPKQTGVSTTDLANLATKIDRDVKIAAVTAWAAQLTKDSEPQPDMATQAAAWKTVLGSTSLPADLDVVFYIGDDALDVVVAQGKLSATFPEFLPRLAEFSQGTAKVCLTPSSAAEPASVLDGSCAQ